MSAAINEGEHDAPRLRQRSLGESLAIDDDPMAIYGLWELRKRAWLLRSGAQLHADGLYAELGGYEALVFLDIRRLPDPDGRLAAFATEHPGWIGDWEAALHESAVSDEDIESALESEVDSEEDTVLTPTASSIHDGAEE